MDPAGGDAWLMRETGAGKVAPWSDVEAIAREMKECWRAWRAGEGRAPMEALARVHNTFERIHPFLDGNGRLGRLLNGVRCKVNLIPLNESPAIAYTRPLDEHIDAFFEATAQRFGGFTLDVAAAPHNAKCENYYTREDDGLSRAWTGRRQRQRHMGGSQAWLHLRVESDFFAVSTPSVLGVTAA